MPLAPTSLVVVTFRPEFQHAWSGLPHVAIFALNRLGGRDGAALVEQLTGDTDLAHETVKEIVARADGVPLFVEELTKAVIFARGRVDPMRVLENQWLKAGHHAAARLAHLEAIRHFERGLAALVALPAGPARDRREVELQLSPGLAHFTARGFASVEAAEAYARSHELAELQGDAAPAIHGGLWPLAVGQRFGQDRRLPQIVGPAATIVGRRAGRRIESGGAPQRLGILFVL